jgi:hypothetical protein
VDSAFDVGENAYGTWIKVSDAEVADAFDDFLAEQDIPTAGLQVEDDGVVILFGIGNRTPFEAGEIFAWFCRASQSGG